MKEKYTQEQLKAMAYDEIVKIETAKSNLQQIQMMMKQVISKVNTKKMKIEDVAEVKVKE